MVPSTPTKMAPTSSSQILVAEGGVDPLPRPAETGRRPERQKNRATARRRLHGEAAMQLKKEPLNFLEFNTVKAATSNDYKKRVQEFLT